MREESGRRRRRFVEFGLVVVVCVFAGCSEASHQRAVDGSADVTPEDGAEFADDAGGDAGSALQPSEGDAEDTSRPVDGGPPYPIVLAHGLGGFEHLDDAERLDYYFEIPARLREEGEVVFTPEVEPFNDSYTRGRQLEEKIEAFLEGRPEEKVNLIGHSQGALDARYVAHHRPEMVASVVSLAGPNHGTRLADIVLELVQYRWSREVVDEIVEFYGRPLYDEAGRETSLFDALELFSEPGIGEFNTRITDQPEVYYASVAGRTDGARGGEACETRHAPDFIEKWRETTDPVDPMFRYSEAALEEPNDGLISVENQKWGEFLGCVPADHFDEVGQIAGDPPGPENDWDHEEFFVSLVEFLHDRGY